MSQDEDRVPHEAALLASCVAFTFVKSPPGPHKPASGRGNVSTSPELLHYERVPGRSGFLGRLIFTQDIAITCRKSDLRLSSRCFLWEALLENVAGPGTPEPKTQVTELCAKGSSVRIPAERCRHVSCPFEACRVE